MEGENQEDTETLAPDDCVLEMKLKVNSHTLVAIADSSPELADISEIINPEKYSSSSRVFRVTALVLRFVHCLREKVGTRSGGPHTQVETTLSADDIEQGHILWVKNVQARLLKDDRFPQWKRQLDLYCDKVGLWRCGGRMSNSALPVTAQNPILLHK